MVTFEYQYHDMVLVYMVLISLADCKKKGMPGNDQKTIQSHTNPLHPYGLVLVTANYIISDGTKNCQNLLHHA